MAVTMSPSTWQICTKCARACTRFDGRWRHLIYKGDTRPPDHSPVFFYVIHEEPW